MSNKPHVFIARIAGKPLCRYCGLFSLNNDATRKAAQKPCKSRDPNDD